MEKAHKQLTSKMHATSRQVYTIIWVDTSVVELLSHIFLEQKVNLLLGAFYNYPSPQLQSHISSIEIFVNRI
jgi:hypothetical protein